MHARACNHQNKFCRVNSGDSVHSDTTKYSNSSIDQGKISSGAGDLAGKLADRILRQVLGVSTVNGSGNKNSRESHRSALIKDGAKYSVTARLKMIDDLTSSTHDMYNGPFSAQWAVEELKRVQEEYEKIKENPDNKDEVQLRRTYKVRKKHQDGGGKSQNNSNDSINSVVRQMNIASPPLVDGDGGDRKTRSGSDADKDGNSSSGSNSNTSVSFSGDEGQMDGGSNKHLKKKVKQHNPAEQINQGKSLINKNEMIKPT